MQLYNTLTRRKEEFQPAGDVVTMYVCGVTSYDHAHVGHVTSTIAFEVLHRYLEYRGYNVRRIQNFTDVDDKIINRANEEGVSSEEISEKYIASFLEDMQALNVLPATVHPRATQEMPQIIGLISSLIDKGYAYEAEGSVYFRVEKSPGYGELSHRSLEDMLEGTRFDIEPGKEYPADFALWKLSKPGEPAWESPWSMGRPGWHIECSAMALHHLGEVIDIHGGGLDLVFPHHENEIAQSRAHTGKDRFARFWLHNGMVRLGNEEMHKSTGWVVRAKDVASAHTADAVRLWIYTAHYRTPLVYDEEGLEVAERAARRIRNALVAPVAPASTGEPLDPAPFKDRFLEAMDDDLNVPQAAAAIFDLVRQINRSRDAGMDVAAARDMLRELTAVLGLTLEEPAASDGVPDEEIDALVRERSRFRAEKQYQEADAVRARLEAMGIALSDSPEGTTWSRV